MPLRLDRMEVEEAGCADPVRLARAIHQQLPGGQGAVPVHEIATALDIIEIRSELLKSIEGALVTTTERNVGKILLNKGSNLQRQRYTLAHELLHFLNPLHKQTAPSGFECRRADMVLRGSSARRPTPHQQQEIEANTFAIELLAPQARMKPFVRPLADLEHVLQAASALDLSKEAAARRYVQLHRELLAVVFSRDGTVSYFDKSQDFPRIALKRGNIVPGMPSRSKAEELPLPMIEANPIAWLRYPYRTVLYAQTLHQSHGYAMTLLLAENDDVDDE